MEELIRDALRLADKREKACRSSPRCPVCAAEQVQLVDWISEIEWKCRHCGHKWNTRA